MTTLEHRNTQQDRWWPVRRAIIETYRPSNRVYRGDVFTVDDRPVVTAIQDLAESWHVSVPGALARCDHNATFDYFWEGHFERALDDALLPSVSEAVLNEQAAATAPVIVPEAWRILAYDDERYRWSEADWARVVDAWLMANPGRMLAQWPRDSCSPDLEFEMALVACAVASNAVSPDFLVAFACCDDPFTLALRTRVVVELARAARAEAAVTGYATLGRRYPLAEIELILDVFSDRYSCSGNAPGRLT